MQDKERPGGLFLGTFHQRKHDMVLSIPPSFYAVSKPTSKPLDVVIYRDNSQRFVRSNQFYIRVLEIEAGETQLSHVSFFVLHWTVGLPLIDY